MNSKKREAWERTRQKGKSYFIWRKGVLGWGIPTAILFQVSMAILNNGLNIDAFTSRKFILNLVTSVIVFPIGGYFWGMWMWYWSNKIYNKENKS
ncbi:peptidylprolyl isomerase [Crassaminicella profunda]|uniref:peptidylprolyl isomerase n=1 Tax=Crassaminicella profunda TaxID=1286698 RepID=UPI001CA792A0|nr:peptidylprolyl isomerase [Crassaminicella profunda]QZY53623.1 peptidylprolyl isomerase [Crassaminicella profunda]